ncbi:VPS4-associated protein 1 [Nemania sp. FL0031]|nr:VPS4-associated protein 1 [Nemania sp. FL0031]
MSVPNIWHHRKVADTAAKGCEICFKPSTSVLVTPEKQDFFYVCPAHLKDRGFCSPIIDHEAVAAKKKKKEMDEEVERLKKEYEEKQRKKKEKEAEKEKDKDKDKDKKDDTDKSESKEGKKEDEATGNKEKSQLDIEEEPRVFALQRTFYQQRLDRKRQAEMAKRNRERLNNPNFFPSVPKGLP